MTFHFNKLPDFNHLPDFLLQICTKMKRFSCLAILFCLIVSSDANCEQAQVKECIEKYMKELEEKPDISSHCARLQVIYGTLFNMHRLHVG